MKRSRWLTLAGLLLFCVVVFVPPIIHGYVYPNIGDDAAVYLTVFEDMKEGKLDLSTPYLAYILVGYLVIGLSDMLGVSMASVFMWFNFAVFALVGVSLYVIVSRLVNRVAGWLALLCAVFCAQGLMFLFYYGQIFNIINIGIILPWLLYFTVRYAAERRVYQVVVLVLLAGCFGCFHTSGIYLPVMAGFIALVYFVYQWRKKQRVDKVLLGVGGGIVAVSAVVFVAFVLLPTMRALEKFDDWEHMNLLTNIGKGFAVPLEHYLLDILSPTIFVLVALIVVYYKDALKVMSDRSRIFTVLLVCIIVVLAVAAFGRASLDPWRQAIDFATVLALFTAVAIGVLISRYRNKVVIGIVAVLIGFGLFHNLPTWFSYNSAMSKADLEAVEYAENFDSYSCSSTIAYWIYDRFGDINHRDNGGEVVLMRDKFMTPRSDESNIWYQKYGWIPDNTYELTKVFDDGRVRVEAWEVMDFFKNEEWRYVESDEICREYFPHDEAWAAYQNGDPHWVKWANKVLAINND